MCSTLVKRVIFAQALAREAGEFEDHDGELSALNDEADMPLEQLLARYGFVTGSDAADAAHASPPPAAAATAGAVILDLTANLIIPGTRSQ